MLREIKLGITLLVGLAVGVLVLLSDVRAETIYITCPDEVLVFPRIPDLALQGWRSTGGQRANLKKSLRLDESVACDYYINDIQFTISRDFPQGMNCTKYVTSGVLGVRKIQNQFKCDPMITTEPAGPGPVTPGRVPIDPTK